MGVAFECTVVYFDLMLIATCFFLGLILLLLLFLFYTIRASRRKNRAKEAGSQAKSCGSMATASPESVGVEPEEEELTHTSGEEGRQPSSSGTEGKQSSPPGAEGEGWTVAGGGKFNHPVYKKLSSLSGELNGLPLSNIKEKLSALNLSSVGEDVILRKRLKQHMRRELIVSEASPPWDLVSQIERNPYGLDYLCVLDFEATCEEVNPDDYLHEIIEFPVLLLNLKTLEIDAEFHSYCRPLLNPYLTEFCTKLTGIEQAQVGKAQTFPQVFKQFTKWMDLKELGSKYKFALATDCPWDIKECLFLQCVFSSIPFPKYAVKWIDIRKLFASFYGIKSGNLSTMLTRLGLQFEGRQHCGLDDSKNIVKVATQMIKDGCVLKYNRFMPNDVLAEYGGGGGGRGGRKKRKR